MSENHKIQIPLEAVADTSGFKDIQQAAQQTATVVQQAGEKASTGLNKIGEGSKKAADALTRDESRMRAAIQRSTLELQSLGKTASEKFELKIAAKGLDAAQFAPMLAQLKELESARAAIAAQQTKDNFLGDLQGQLALLREQAQLQGMSAEAALRYKAAQAGASSEAAQLITELTQIKAAQEAAATAAVRQAEAQKQAAAAARVRDNFVADVQGQIEALRLQSMTADEALRYKAAQAGATAETAHLVTQLSAMRAAQEAAAVAARKQAESEKEAAAAARSRAAFLDNLKGRANSIDDRGNARPESELLAMRAAQMGVSKEADVYIAKLRKVEAAHAGVGMSARQTAFAMRQLPMQMTDVVTSLAGGMNPALVLLQQGGQIKDSFGGIGNAVRAVTGLITPMTAAIAGGAAAAGVLGLAMANVESHARSLATLRAQLTATGQAGMFAGGDLKAFLDQLAEVPGVSREAATGIISEFSKVRGISGAVFKELGTLAGDFAKATGTDIPTAARALAQAFVDPERGADQLAKAIDKIPAGVVELAKHYANLGRTAEAQIVLVNGLRDAIKGINEQSMTPLQKSVDDLSKSWDRATREMGESEGVKKMNAGLAAIVDKVKWLIDNASKMPDWALMMVPGGGLPTALIRGAGEKQFQGRGATGSFDLPPGATGAGVQSLTGEALFKEGQRIANSYSGQAKELRKLTADRETLNKALQESLKLQTEEGRALQRNFRESLAGVEEKIAAVKKRGVNTGGAREADQTRAAALEANLQAVRDRLQDEREAMAFHERMLQGQFNAGEVSVKEFYDRKVQAIRSGVQATVDALEREKELVRQDLLVERDPSNRQKLEGKVDHLTSEQEKARARGEREVLAANQAMGDSFRQLSDEVTAYRINLAELQGDEITAARLRLQQASQQDNRLAKRAEGTPSEIPPEQLRQAAQARQNRAVLDQAQNNTVIITRAQALEEERIAMAQRAGAMSSLEAMAQVGEARKRAVAQLEEIVQKQEEIARQAENSDNWKLKLDTAEARQELERLKEQMDPLAEHFRSLFTDATGDLFADLANNPKGAKDAIKRWASSITTELNREFGRDLANKIFGKEGIFGGLPGKFGEIFGGGKGKDGKPPAPLVDTAPLSGSLNALKSAGVEPLTASMGRLQGAIDQVAAKAGAVAPSAGPVTATDLPPAAGVTTGDFARMDRGQAPAPAAQEQAQGALKALASQGVDPAAAALQKFTPATEAATSALAKPDVSLQRLASAADAAAAALQRIAGIQPGAPGAPGIPGLPGAPGAAPTFGTVDTAGGGTRVRFPTLENDDEGNPMPLIVEDLAKSNALVADSSKTASAGMMDAASAALSLAGAAKSGGSALALLPQIIQMIQAAAAASSASSAVGGGMGGLGSLFGGGGAFGGPPNPFAMGMSQSVSTAGTFFLTPMATGGYTGDVPPDQATGIVHGREFVFSAPAVKALGVDTLKVLHENARGGSREAALGTIAKIAGSTEAPRRAGATPAALPASVRIEAAAAARGRVPGDTDHKPAAAKAVAPDVLHVLRDGGRDEVLRTITRIAEGGEPSVPGASSVSPSRPVRPPSDRLAVESDSTLAVIDRPRPVRARESGEAAVSRAIARITGMGEPAAPEVAGPQAVSRDVLEVIRRKTSESHTETLLDAMPRYHTGGIVERVAEIAGAKLKPNEVPAILMGGPKGQREEVLTADDPRHKDNLSPGMAKFFDRLPRYHEGGIVGEKSFLVPNSTAPARESEDAGPGGDGRRMPSVVVNVTATPETTRATAKQMGVNVWRGMQTAAGSNR